MEQKWHKYPEETPEEYRKIIMYNHNWNYYKENVNKSPSEIKNMLEKCTPNYQYGIYVDGMFYCPTILGSIIEDTLCIDWENVEIYACEKEKVPEYWTYLPEININKNYDEVNNESKSR